MPATKYSDVKLQSEALSLRMLGAVSADADHQSKCIFIIIVVSY